MGKTILITGAGSGFGEGTAFGLARLGHDVIATAQIYAQVSDLKRKAEKEGLTNLRVERLDLLDEYDVRTAQSWDVDVLFNNAGMGEAGPVSEIPIDLVRKNFEVNVFATLALTQGFIKKWVNYGASVRAAQWMILGGKARALMHGRYHVGFDDIRALAHPVLRHRILLNFHAQSERVTTDQIVAQLIKAVPTPKSGL